MELKIVHQSNQIKLTKELVKETEEHKDQKNPKRKLKDSHKICEDVKKIEEFVQGQNHGHGKNHSHGHGNNKNKPNEKGLQLVGHSHGDEDYEED